jgi:FkbM family methyltransferase
LKTATRNGLPPFLLNAGRKARRSVRSRKPYPVPGTDRLIHHRGTNVDEELFDQIFLGQVYDLRFLRRHKEITRFYDDCASPLIVDCGANIGASSVWFATRFPRSVVIAIEPEAGNFRMLERNAAGINVRPVHGAISSRPGRLRVLDPGLGSAGYRTEALGGADSSGEVRAYTLDELVDLVPGGNPFLLKVDIEGAESDLFRGNRGLLDRFPLVIVELHDWMLPRSASSKSFIEWHVGQDRDFVQQGEITYSLSNRLLPEMV